MDFSAAMDPIEMSKLKMQVDAVNHSFGERTAKSTMDKNDFLKILITQLTYQDPTQPMQDKEFVAQMAQFSTLEQITNMSQEFSKLTNMMNASQALNMLGRNVEVLEGDNLVTGIVDAVAGQDHPQLLINGKYYDYTNVERVLN